MTSGRDTAKLVEYLRDLHVETERDLELGRHLHRLLQTDENGDLLPEPVRFAAGKETRGIVVTEAAGGGKTTAIRHVLQTTDALGLNPDTGKPRYLELEVPSPASLKSVGLAILAELGLQDVREKTPTTEIWKLVRVRLSREGIVVIWLDEAHDLILAKSAGETETTLRMIKSLMQGEHAVIPILSGTQRLGEMTSFDPQVSRRFTKINPRDLEFGADENDLLGLTHGYCNAVGLELRLPEDLPARLIHASRKRFGRAVETIINAIENALMDGGSTLEGRHFSEAWAMQEGCAADNNVFEAPDWLDFELDRGAEEYECARTRRQKKKLERS